MEESVALLADVIGQDAGVLVCDVLSIVLLSFPIEITITTFVLDQNVLAFVVNPEPEVKWENFATNLALLFILAR